MSMDYIRRTYGVPAKRGGRIVFSGTLFNRAVTGVVIGTRNANLRVLMDHNGQIWTLHPTWAMEYIETPTVPVSGAEGAQH